VSRYESNAYVSDEVILDPEGRGESAPINPLLKIHQLLRGRYVWAILTGTVLAITASYVVSKLPVVQPKYVSTGLIQMRPALDPVLYQTAFNSRLADYDQFLESQVPIIKSQRIILQAMDLKPEQLAEMDRPDMSINQRLKAWDNKTWPDVSKSWGGIDPVEQMARLTDGLEVTHPRNTQVLQISFTDRDPGLAPVAVKLIIAAYKKLYDVDVDNFNKRMDLLKKKEGELRSTVKSMSNDSLKVQLGDFGSVDFLARTLDSKQAELLSTDQMIGTGRSQVQTMADEEFRRAQQLFAEGHLDEANAVLNPVIKVWPDLFPTNNRPAQLHDQIAAKLGPDNVTPAAATQSSMDLTPELAAAADQLMANYLNTRAQAKDQLALLEQRYGPTADPVRNARAVLELSQKNIDDRLALLKAKVLSAGTTSGNGPLGADGGKLTLAEANRRLSTLSGRRTQLDADIKALQSRVSNVREISENIQTAQQELDTVESTLHKLEFEGVSGGRTEVISPGDKPLRPEKDRRLPASIAAGIGGLAIGFGIFATIGLFNRRLHSVADARESLDGSQRILGILPSLPDNLEDPDQAASVAFAVHHIRTLLQLGGSEKRSTTFAITSAAPQEGKTSLTMALGMSYAAIGAKTLLIDTDVIGAGLTSRMGAIARARLGSILIRKGVLTAEQLESGLAESRQSGKRLGRVLVKLGFIDDKDKKQALADQAAGSRGFLDLLDGYPMDDCITQVGTPNLSVMPVGNVADNHVGRISIDTVRRIIAEARSRFDIVLFDTGPLMGHLEAGIVAAAVDEVIVAVSRGAQVPLLQKTFLRLRELEAHIAGIVFNRAKLHDLERSGYSASASIQRFTSPEVNGARIKSSNGAPHFGPIADAVEVASKRQEDS